MTADELIEQYYHDNPEAREKLLRHNSSVARKALEILKDKNLPLNPEEVKAAAMFHDIGIIFTDAPGIFCFGKEPYIRHGIIGAELLRKHGIGENFARVAERHTGAGISLLDIEKYNLPLPPRDFLPESLLERLICYADKFYSKSGDMKEKSFEKVLDSMQRHFPNSVERFLKLHSEFS